MRANVCFADTSEQRIRQSMHGSIGIGMTLELHGMRNVDAAKHHPIAWFEGMDVEALSDADVRTTLVIIARKTFLGAR
jgi:hypothetical protein